MRGSVCVKGLDQIGEIEMMLGMVWIHWIGSDVADYIESEDMSV